MSIPPSGKHCSWPGMTAILAFVARRGPSITLEVRRVPGWQTVEIDHGRQMVRVPRGVNLDLGATAKALAADRAAEAVHGAVGGGVLVSLGGDLADRGTGAERRVVRSRDRRSRQRPGSAGRGRRPRLRWPCDLEHDGAVLDAGDQSSITSSTPPPDARAIRVGERSASLLRTASMRIPRAPLPSCTGEQQRDGSSHSVCPRALYGMTAP